MSNECRSRIWYECGCAGLGSGRCDCFEPSRFDGAVCRHSILENDDSWECESPVATAMEGTDEEEE